jgi:hypothetical protein
MSASERNEVGRHVCTEGCNHEAHAAAMAIEEVRISDSKNGQGYLN